MDKLAVVIRKTDLALSADTISDAVIALKRLPERHHSVTESLIERLKKSQG